MFNSNNCSIPNCNKKVLCRGVCMNCYARNVRSGKLKPKKRGIVSLAKSHPELARQADGWDPEKYSAGSDKRMGWFCGSGHRWEATIGSRAGLGRGCPFCSGRTVVSGVNDLLTLHPEIAKYCDGTWNPSDYLPKSNKNVGWICENGHRTQAVIANRVQNKSGCAFCNLNRNEFMVPGIDDFATHFPEIAKESDGTWNPSKYAKFSGLKVGWVCKKHGKYRMTICKRAIGQKCPKCKEVGFNPRRSGFVYLVESKQMNAQKIGITNVMRGHNARLKRLERLQFTPIDIIEAIDGDTARDIESEVILKLSRSGIPVGIAEAIGFGKFDGYSESWPMSAARFSSIEEIINGRPDSWFIKHTRWF